MIYVFKTSVKSKIQIKKLKPHIDKMLPTAAWNFDLEDCDKILRIESENDIILKVKKFLKTHNFNCEALEYKTIEIQEPRNKKNSQSKNSLSLD